jgi:hypothetical protein
MLKIVGSKLELASAAVLRVVIIYKYNESGIRYSSYSRCFEL